MKPSGLYDSVVQQNLELRELGEADLPLLLEVERLSYSRPWTLSVFHGCLEPHYHRYGVFDGGALRAYCILVDQFDEQHLLNLAVHPEARRDGLGKRLLRHACQAAAHQGIWRMILEVRKSNGAARRLYEREGFEKIGQRPGYYPDPGGAEDALVMALEFRPGDHPR